MPRVAANGLELQYESFGHLDDPVVLLIMGLGAQLIHWPDAYCEGIAARGYRVIRFDNREAGLSTRLDHLPTPNVTFAMLKVLTGRKPQAPYLLDDMALDALGLLDALDVAQAHIVGASLGGMIAQIIAAKHADRCLSLTSIMSTSGHRSVPLAKPALLARLGRRPKSNDREARIQHAMQTMRMIGSSSKPRPEAEIRDVCERAVDRAYYPPGVARQFMASLASGNRVRLLKTVTVPTLMIHGRDDPLVRVEGGIHTAELVPNAKLEILDDMGHDMPPPLIPRLVELTTDHLDTASD